MIITKKQRVAKVHSHDWEITKSGNHTETLLITKYYLFFIPILTTKIIISHNI